MLRYKCICICALVTALIHLPMYLFIFLINDLDGYLRNIRIFFEIGINFLNICKYMHVRIHMHMSKHVNIGICIFDAFIVLSICLFIFSACGFSVLYCLSISLLLMFCWYICFLFIDLSSHLFVYLFICFSIWLIIRFYFSFYWFKID